jgi:hypothetical protein
VIYSPKQLKILKKNLYKEEKNSWMKRIKTQKNIQKNNINQIKLKEYKVMKKIKVMMKMRTMLLIILSLMKNQKKRISKRKKLKISYAKLIN